MSVCKHIADTLKSFLVDDDVKQLSVGALQQVNLDLVQCESKSMCLALHIVSLLFKCKARLQPLFIAHVGYTYEPFCNQNIFRLWIVSIRTAAIKYVLV